jgi:hypothetical protein
VTALARVRIIGEEPNPSEPGAGRVFSCPHLRDGHPGPWIKSIRKRGDCPREQAAGNGGGNRRQGGKKEPVSNVNFRIGMGNGELNAL